MDLDEQALNWLADAGYEPMYGARPLKRLIQRELENPLAMAILEGRIKDNSVVKIRVVNDKLDIVEDVPTGEETAEYTEVRPAIKAQGGAPQIADNRK